MSKLYWIIKQEPEDYSWNDFCKTGSTDWTGVRNYQARNHLRAMRVGDHVCFYHSVTDKKIVGIAQVVQTAFPDATAEEGDWSAVTLVPLTPLKVPVTLAQIKQDELLQNIALVRQSRLSVSPLSSEEFKQILKLSETRLP
ncbi:MAG: EVE domain-containing protein [Verrucomicrobia bacterium]|jgi:predicted RNA-binding protein with PUA-like domain|nr:MAG: EVE domain-containing protein [Verrucomicrobiota bacterium]